MYLQDLAWPAYRVLAAVSVWALHFGIVYGATAVACQRGFEQGLPWVIGGATAAAALAALALIVSGVRGSRPHGAAGWIAVAASVLALGAILWQASPLLWADRCA